MKQNMRLNPLQLLKNAEGSTLVLAALWMTAFIGLAGIAVESGHGYYAYQQLKASTNAAVLAAAEVLPDTVTAASDVTAYSSMSGQKNASPLLTNVSATPTFLCVSNSYTTNLGCALANNGSGSYNAVQVKQTADVPSWFAGLFGVNTFHLSYTATAAVAGGTPNPWNIAIILDATGSMSNPDSGKQCSGTQETCALKGIQTLLLDLYPCYLGQTCGSTSYVDAVSLFVFPPMTTTTMPYDYCSGGTPSNVNNGYYVVPTLSSTYTYQVTGFSNNYKSTDTATGLNTSSNIVKAAGYSGTSCTGVYPKGGSGTYYAEVIKTAQAALVTQQNSNLGSKNAIIILGDSDMNGTASFSNSNGYYVSNYSSSSHLQPSANGSLNGVTGNNPTSPAWPSAVGQCGQAVLAAQAATAAGTRVYTIGYGAGISGTCSTDATYTSTGNTSYGGGAWPATSHGSDNGKQACDALAAMASRAAYFYSDDADSCVATSPTNSAIKQLTSAFQAIANGLTTPRLIPNP